MIVCPFCMSPCAPGPEHDPDDYLIVVRCACERVAVWEDAVRVCGLRGTLDGCPYMEALSDETDPTSGPTFWHYGGSEEPDENETRPVCEQEAAEILENFLLEQVLES